MTDVAYKKNGKCSACGCKDRKWDYYTRAWNDLCNQAAGDAGYYCTRCRHIDFHTPDFETWLAMMPKWIVRNKGDEWRELPQPGDEPL
jgi:hypothetical protein